MFLYQLYQPILLINLLTTATTSAESEKGIDVSHWQGNVDWVRVKSTGISFAVAKATEGDTYEDPTYKYNCEGIKDNSIKAGAYHYLLGATEAQSQVTNILGVLGRCRPDVLVIDVEESRNEGVLPTKMADTLHHLLEGLKPSFSDIFIYTGPFFWENKVDWKKYDFSQHKLWIAHYTSKQTPTIPTTWKDRGYTWWQYSNKGSVDGVTGPVDLDKSNA